MMDEPPEQRESHGDPMSPAQPEDASRRGVPRMNRVIAVAMLVLTILFGVGGGILLAAAGLQALMGEPAFIHDVGPRSGMLVGGWIVTAGAGAICCVLASIQNRLRRRLLRPTTNNRLI